MIRRLRLFRSIGRLQGRLLLVVALAAAAVSGGDIIGVQTSRLNAISNARWETAILARSLADQTGSIFQTMDTVLVGLRERVETDGTGPVDLERLGRIMQTRVAALPMIHRIAVIDESGRVLVLSGKHPAGSLLPHVQTQDFQVQARSPDRAMLLGWPMQDPLDKVWVIPVSRRLNHADGSFAGIVRATVATDFFRKTYANLGTGENSVILLARTDGVALIRWPADRRGEAQKLPMTGLFGRMLASGGNLALERASPVDGLIRLGSYQRLAATPAVVMVARSQREVLATWYGLAMSHGLILLTELTVLGLLGWRLSGKIGEEQRAQTVLQDANRDLALSETRIAQANSRLEMAEQMSQVGHWTFLLSSPPQLTWSEEVYRMHGLDPETFAVSPESVMGVIHPQDRPIVRAAVTAAAATGNAFEFGARLIQPDGVVRHVLSRGLPQRSPAGIITSIFGVFMDITERKHSEAALLAAHKDVEAANRALEAANHALAEIALLDALTGLGNRRRFDTALDLEFRRAVRAETSLAMILIDVDHFKQFNDTYGHQAGDACLRAIASVIPPLLNRPGDTASRYGGEEIVVLLPGNTQAGALAMAHRIVDAVRALAIPHAGSEHGVVTISAGVEAFVPVYEKDDAAELVEHADLALYTAKRGGRDCVSLYCLAEAAVV